MFSRYVLRCFSQEGLRLRHRNIQRFRKVSSLRLPKKKVPILQAVVHSHLEWTIKLPPSVRIVVDHSVDEKIEV
ncbi:hypothetical protein GGE45_006481 [Rhizobium aethiopicum]|uniref:Uncharacterized protein n=1 Tax=Rhizobium aethiopicum TaxID=1138170 RepID=A0A7W6VS79_9HYPH|nr:hypothetical protein [Rhizobium aethiopicum]MBB4584097.1 hypothetical protein [Rhizobium aethiopicum]